eukprot:524366-Hanusia_phi.AAC.1
MERAGKEKAEELSCVVRIGWTSENRKRGEERRGEERGEGRGGEEKGQKYDIVIFLFDQV